MKRTCRRRLRFQPFFSRFLRRGTYSILTLSILLLADNFLQRSGHEAQACPSRPQTGLLPSSADPYDNPSGDVVPIMVILDHGTAFIASSRAVMRTSGATIILSSPQSSPKRRTFPKNVRIEGGSVQFPEALRCLSNPVRRSSSCCRLRVLGMARLCSFLPQDLRQRAVGYI